MRVAVRVTVSPDFGYFVIVPSNGAYPSAKTSYDTKGVAVGYTGKVSCPFFMAPP